VYACVSADTGAYECMNVSVGVMRVCRYCLYHTPPYYSCHTALFHSLQHGYSALHLVCFGNYLDGGDGGHFLIAKYLIDRGAQVNIKAFVNVSISNSYLLSSSTADPSCLCAHSRSYFA